ncbi:hypothetical protein ABT120_40705 [Nonomuraea angiospora]|uniref:hypothetical protein n=1 Tax=Nonomuraea angiospora TaxID=46172 RepID=UPI003328E6CD
MSSGNAAPMPKAARAAAAADTLVGLGGAHHAFGDRTAAETAWQRHSPCTNRTTATWRPPASAPSSGRDFECRAPARHGRQQSYLIRA